MAGGANAVNRALRAACVVASVPVTPFVFAYAAWLAWMADRAFRTRQPEAWARARAQWVEQQRTP